jgi:AI-2 transport protein TqsA
LDGAGHVRLLPTLLAAVLLAAALFFARSVFAAVAFALFVMALVWPIQSSLQAWMSKYAALALTVLLSLLVLTLLVSAITWGFSQLGHWVLGNVNRFQEVYFKSAEWLEGHGIFVTGLLGGSI